MKKMVFVKSAATNIEMNSCDIYSQFVQMRYHKIPIIQCKPHRARV